MIALLLLVALAADEPVKAVASDEEIQTYLEREEKSRVERVAFLEREVLRLKAEYRSAKVAVRPAINDAIERTRDALDGAREGGVRYCIKSSPEVGTVGYIEEAEIVCFPSKDVGLVCFVWVETVGSGVHQRRENRSSYVLVAGLDSQKFADGTKWKPEQPLRAMQVERGPLVDAALSKWKARWFREPPPPKSLVMLEMIDSEPIDKAREKRDRSKKLPPALKPVPKSKGEQTAK